MQSAALITALRAASVTGGNILRLGEVRGDASGLAASQDALAALLSQAKLPRAVRRAVADLYCDVLELCMTLPLAEQLLVTPPPPVEQQSLAPLREPQRVTGEQVRLPSSILYQIRREIFPAERMVVGAVRRNGPDRSLEAVYDVTGRASLGHCEPDPEKFTRAMLDFDASGAFMGLWAHSHPGNTVGATTPSGEDWDSYRKRVASGDSKRLIGAVFAGHYVRFFGAPKAVALVGVGLHPVDGEEHVYEFAA